MSPTFPGFSDRVVSYKCVLCFRLRQRLGVSAHMCVCLGCPSVCVCVCVCGCVGVCVSVYACVDASVVLFPLPPHWVTGV